MAESSTTVALVVLPARLNAALRHVIAYVAGAGFAAAMIPVLDKFF